MNYYNDVVAIIDDGISCYYYKDELIFDLVIEETNIKNNNNAMSKDEASLNHGTICGLLLKEYIPSIRIGSISLIDTTFSSLLTALGWCLRNNIKYIQLSIGGIQPSEEEEKNLFVVIDELVKNGCIVVAAIANSNQYTVPACFPHVFAVRSRFKDKKVSYIGKNIFGVQFETTGETLQTANSINYYSRNSNSFAVPKVMAHLLKENEMYKQKMKSRISSWLSKRFELVYPVLTVDYYFIGREKVIERFVPSMIKIKESSTYNSDNLPIGEAVIFDSLATDSRISQIINCIKGLRYCIFLGPVSNSVRQMCLNKNIFYWDPLSYTSTINNFLNSLPSKFIYSAKEICPVVYVTSSGNWLNFCNKFYNYLSLEGYKCHFVALDEGCFLPGYDYCPQVHHIKKFVEIISHFFGPSVITLLGPKKYYETNFDLQCIVDAFINLNSYQNGLCHDEVSGNQIWMGDAITYSSLSSILQFLKTKFD